MLLYNILLYKKVFNHWNISGIEKSQNALFVSEIENVLFQEDVQFLSMLYDITWLTVYA